MSVVIQAAVFAEKLLAWTYTKKYAEKITREFLSNILPVLRTLPR